MGNNEWSISNEVIFEIEHKSFAESVFPMAYKTKIDGKSFRVNTWEKPVDSYLIQQYFGFMKVLKIPTCRINWVIVRC